MNANRIRGFDILAAILVLLAILVAAGPYRTPAFLGDPSRCMATLLESKDEAADILILGSSPSRFAFDPDLIEYYLSLQGMNVSVEVIYHPRNRVLKHQAMFEEYVLNRGLPKRLVVAGPLRPKDGSLLLESSFGADVVAILSDQSLALTRAAAANGLELSSGDWIFGSELPSEIQEGFSTWFLNQVGKLGYLSGIPYELNPCISNRYLGQFETLQAYFDYVDGTPVKPPIVPGSNFWTDPTSYSSSGVETKLWANFFVRQSVKTNVSVISMPMNSATLVQRQTAAYEVSGLDYCDFGRYFQSKLEIDGVDVDSLFNHPTHINRHGRILSSKYLAEWLLGGAYCLK